VVKAIAFRVLVGATLVLGFSYFFEASYYLSLIIVAVLVLFGETIHLPENMPGAYDNPKGEVLHPYKALVIAVILIFTLVGFGYVFPEIYE